jgi:hypothetical protein
MGLRSRIATNLLAKRYRFFPEQFMSSTDNQKSKALVKTQQLPETERRFQYRGVAAIFLLIIVFATACWLYLLSKFVGMIFLWLAS